MYIKVTNVRYSIFLIFFFSSILMFQSCGTTKPIGSFDASKSPRATDYSLEKNWAALPNKVDLADRVPDPALKDEQSTATIDVFFLHPTSYTGKRNDIDWNASVDNPAINKRTNNGAILNQASIFNGVGRVYAPYYRQAHLEAYYTKDMKSGRAALDLAYEDVRTAFRYFIAHYNQNRPFIIAAHSQGTTHAIRLINEEIENTNLKNRMVVAYLVGIAVQKDQFSNFRPCEKPYDTGCICAWRTYEKSYIPKVKRENILVTNPLSWETNSDYVSADMNKGSVYRKYKLVTKNLVDAQIKGQFLGVTKPKMPGAFLIRSKNYHVGDYNLFWMNVRENAKLRESSFWK